MAQNLYRPHDLNHPLQKMKVDRGELDSRKGVEDPSCWDVGYGGNGCDQPVLEPGFWPTHACNGVSPTSAFSQCGLLPMLEASPVLLMRVMLSLPSNFM